MPGGRVNGQWLQLHVPPVRVHRSCHLNGVHIASPHVACRDEKIHDGLADRPGDNSVGCDVSGPHEVHNGGYRNYRLAKLPQEGGGVL